MIRKTLLVISLVLLVGTVGLWVRGCSTVGRFDDNIHDATVIACPLRDPVGVEGG